LRLNFITVARNGCIITKSEEFAGRERRVKRPFKERTWRFIVRARA
jgi:hypothetical protein